MKTPAATFFIPDVPRGELERTYQLIRTDTETLTGQSTSDRRISALACRRGHFNFGTRELPAARREELGDVIDRLIRRARTVALRRVRFLGCERTSQARAYCGALIFILVAVVAALINFAECRITALTSAAA